VNDKIFPFQFTLFTRGDTAGAMVALQRFVDQDEAEVMFEQLESEAALIMVA
jgi:hypothetical protein